MPSDQRSGRGGGGLNRIRIGVGDEDVVIGADGANLARRSREVRRQTHQILGAGDGDQRGVTGLQGFGRDAIHLAGVLVDPDARGVDVFEILDGREECLCVHEPSCRVAGVSFRETFLLITAPCGDKWGIF